jgi:hypothetical protein
MRSSLAICSALNSCARRSVGARDQLTHSRPHLRLEQVFDAGDIGLRHVLGHAPQRIGFIVQPQFARRHHFLDAALVGAMAERNPRRGDHVDLIVAQPFEVFLVRRVPAFDAEAHTFQHRCDNGAGGAVEGEIGHAEADGRVWRGCGCRDEHLVYVNSSSVKRRRGIRPLPRKHLSQNAENARHRDRCYAALKVAGEVLRYACSSPFKRPLPFAAMRKDEPRLDRLLFSPASNCAQPALPSKKRRNDRKLAQAARPSPPSGPFFQPANTRRLVTPDPAALPVRPD